MALRNQLNSTIVKRFIEIVQSRLDNLNKPTVSDLDDTNWANKEAFRQGRVLELMTILNLFEEGKR